MGRRRMSLANFLLRNALGNDRAPDRLDVALFLGAKEVQDPGYERASIAKGSWNIMNERASATAVFGPFKGAAAFDRSIVFQGQKVVDEKLLPGEPRRSGSTDVVRLLVELDLTAK